MGPTKPLGLIIGLIGDALVAYAIYTLLHLAGCVDKIACDAPSALPSILLPAGVVVMVVGMLFGGGTIVFSCLFLGIGLGAIGAAGFSGIADMQSFGWIFGGLFFVGGLIPLVGGRVARAMSARKQADAMELIRTGTKGVGTITDVADTGITINNNPRVRITMRIDPIDGSAPVERHKTATVSRVGVPRVGERYPAWFDRADPDKWAFGTDMEASAAPEIKEMFARAAAGADAPSSAGNMVGEMERLTELWKSGALNDREFAEAKARLLDG